MQGSSALLGADSLKSILPQLPDSQKVFVMCDIAFNYRLQNTDSALHYSSAALRLAEIIDHPAAIAQALNDQGIVYSDQNRYTEALHNYNRALTIRQQLNDSIGTGALHSKIGVIHQKRGAYSLAIDHQLEALRIFEALAIVPYVAICQNNVAILHYNMGAPQRALDMHQEALKTRQTINDEYGVASSYANIANVLLFMKDTAGATQKYEQAIAMFEQLNDPEGLSTNLHNLSSCVVKDNPQKALELLAKALAIREQLGDSKTIASTLSSLGLAHYHLKNKSKAREYLLSALKLARKADVLAEQLHAYELLARLHRDEGHADSTYYYFAQYYTLKDSAFNEALRQDFAELQTLYENEKKEAQISLLSEQNKVIDLQVKQNHQQIWLMAIGFIAFVLVSGTSYLGYRSKQRARLAAEILKEREQGMSAVIAAIENERERIARDLHDGVGQQLSGLKMGWQRLVAEIAGTAHHHAPKAAQLTQVLDETCSEVRSISHRMMPRSLSQYGLIPAIADMLDKSLTPAGINHEFEYFGLENERFSAEVELSIYRVMQELVNNILKHSGASSVSVQLYKTAGYLIARIEDNGCGLSVEKRDTGGIGMKNMRSRLSTVGGVIHFESDGGLRATIRITL